MLNFLTDKYGKEVAKQLMPTVETTYLNSDEYEFTDNFRIARTINPDEVKAYENALEDGGDGFYDTSIIVWVKQAPYGPGEYDHDYKPEVYLFGFNYGH